MYMQIHTYIHTQEDICVLQATRPFLNEQPLYLGPLLYFAHPEPGALWQGLGRSFSL